jgi:hypothetical protein
MFCEFIREFYTRCSAQKSATQPAVEPSQSSFGNGIFPENQLPLTPLARSVCAISHFVGHPRLPHCRVQLQVSARATRFGNVKAYRLAKIV